MKTLADKYLDFINEYDPYHQEEPIENLSEMLYNLEEIHEELTDTLAADYDEELFYLNQHLETLIEQFKAEGVERWEL